MKRVLKRLNLFVLALLMALSIMPLKPAMAVDAVNITILHTNDIHGRVTDNIGLAKLAAKVNEVRAANPNTLLLDAGDTLHGLPIVTVSKGENMVRIMNAMKYDAMAPGNHDFNYGQDRLVELSKIAQFPIISANVLKADKTTLFTPYTIKEVGGVKVGIFGLTTPETTYKTNPKNVEGLTFDDPVETAKKMVAELEGKCDIIIALAHIGIDKASSVTSEMIAKEVEGIDIIVDGHSHSSLPEGELVNDTLIVQTGEYDNNLGIVNITYKDGKVAEKKASHFTKASAAELTPDPDAAAIIDEIKKGNDQVMAEVVGTTDIKLIGERANVRTGETNLGDLITDAMKDATGADAALTNGGGIRASIDAGEITKGEIITVLPFGNYVVLKEVKGSDIIAALENGISAYPEALGAFPHVSGITFKFNSKAEAGKRIVEAKIGGKPIEPDKIYKLATNDFMANGGDNYTMLKNGKLLNEYPALDEVVAEYIKKNGVETVGGRVNVIEIQHEPEVKVYIVKKGDNLTRIGRMFGFTWQVLAKYNNLKNPNLIFPNQKILIPAN